MSATGRRVVVVGGGIAGLTAAHVLALAGRDVLLLEGSAALGGKLRALRSVGGVEVDVGAEAMLARRPEGVELATELGLPVVHPAVTTSRIWTEGRAPADAAVGDGRARRPRGAGLLRRAERRRAGPRASRAGSPARARAGRRRGRLRRRPGGRPARRRGGRPARRAAARRRVRRPLPAALRPGHRPAARGLGRRFARHARGRRRRRRRRPSGVRGCRRGSGPTGAHAGARRARSRSGSARPCAS